LRPGCPGPGPAQAGCNRHDVKLYRHRITWVRLFWSNRPGRWHKSRRRAVPRHAAGPADPTDPVGPASPAAAAASSDMNVTFMSSWRHECHIHVVTGPPARPGRTPPAPAPGHSLRKSHTESTRAGYRGGGAARNRAGSGTAEADVAGEVPRKPAGLAACSSETVRFPTKMLRVEFFHALKKFEVTY